MLIFPFQSNEENIRFLLLQGISAIFALTIKLSECYKNFHAVSLMKKRNALSIWICIKIKGTIKSWLYLYKSHLCGWFPARVKHIAWKIQIKTLRIFMAYISCAPNCFPPLGMIQRVKINLCLVFIQNFSIQNNAVDIVHRFFSNFYKWLNSDCAFELVYTETRKNPGHCKLKCVCMFCATLYECPFSVWMKRQRRGK